MIAIHTIPFPTRVLARGGQTLSAGSTLKLFGSDNGQRRVLFIISNHSADDYLMLTIEGQDFCAVPKASAAGLPSVIALPISDDVTIRCPGDASADVTFTVGEIFLETQTSGGSQTPVRYSPPAHSRPRGGA